MREDGLTKKEGRVVDATVEVVRAFGKLKPGHPDEEAELFDAVHRIQCLMAARAMARLFPEGWLSGG